jgi:large subunit ribosomal protein L22
MIQTAKAQLRYLRMAPRKIRLIVDLIRGLHVTEAMKQLQFSKKDAARPIMKLLASAIANAEHNAQMKTETLIVKTAFVDGGPILYRSMPRAQGRATPLRKRTSHITIILEGAKSEEGAEVKAKKVIKKK